MEWIGNSNAIFRRKVLSCYLIGLFREFTYQFFIDVAHFHIGDIVYRLSHRHFDETILIFLVRIKIEVVEFLHNEKQKVILIKPSNK